MVRRLGVEWVCCFYLVDLVWVIIWIRDETVIRRKWALSDNWWLNKIILEISKKVEKVIVMIEFIAFCFNFGLCWHHLMLITSSIQVSCTIFCPNDFCRIQFSFSSPYFFRSNTTIDSCVILLASSHSVDSTSFFCSIISMTSWAVANAPLPLFTPFLPCGPS